MWSSGQATLPDAEPGFGLELEFDTTMKTEDPMIHLKPVQSCVILKDIISNICSMGIMITVKEKNQRKGEMGKCVQGSLQKQV